MRRLFFAAIVALTACTAPTEEGGGNEMASVQPSPAAPAVDDVPLKSDPGNASSAAPATPVEPGDECRASSYRYLVGQPRSSIPEPPEGAEWRIACSGCPVTMDYSPARMNIFYNEETGIIEEVRCG